jgi:ATP-dependent DNA helicase RecG
MDRLLNGDVGSGKTVVAAMAAALVVKNGYRVALMAPTEILANQHYLTLTKILEPHGISIALITSSSRKLRANSCQLSADIFVGTHALLHLKEPIENLGLVIIDEQHRFGVDQREKLLASCFQLSGKSQNLTALPCRQAGNSSKLAASFRPHFLSMTATPIPRTMSLVIFADLDVSVIDEMPADRKKIITKVVTADKRQATYSFIQKEIDQGHQAFVICPLIEEIDQSNKSKIINNDIGVSLFENDRKAVTKEYEKLSKQIFPKMKIAMLHGKMPATPRRGGRGFASGGKSKQEVMEAFKNGKYDILVSTSVVEVGVDIPGATVMMIENAEHFGLAQLHQFRGRVGRSDMQSYCFLFSSASAFTGRARSSSSENAQKRLGYMESIDSGFELAEKDLKLRGPGVLHGYKQSGFWDFQFASLSDKIMIEKATESAKAIVGKIDKYPQLLEKISDRSKHLE